MKKHTQKKHRMMVSTRERDLILRMRNFRKEREQRMKEVAQAFTPEQIAKLEKILGPRNEVRKERPKQLPPPLSADEL